MLKKYKWMWSLMAGGLALALAIGALWMFSKAGVVNAAEELETITQIETKPGLLGEGYLNHGGRGWEFGGSPIDYDQLLADALGDDVDVEDIKAAYETARAAALEQAVKEGLLTEEQAERMQDFGGFGRKAFAFGRDPKNFATDAIDEEALLAEALGVSVEDLQKAREEANQAAVAQAIKEGLITQEQADASEDGFPHRGTMMGRTMMGNTDRNTWMAEALGMTQEEFKAALEGGKSLSDLMDEKGLDAETLRENMAAEMSEKLDQAVEDGTLTQEQADAMKERMLDGQMMPGGRFNCGEPGDFEGHPGFRNRFKDWDAPEGEDDSSGSMWRFPRRNVTQEGNDV